MSASVKAIDALQSGSWEKFRKERQLERGIWEGETPPIPSESWAKESYMEDQQFIMPMLEDGVIAVGELYDIRQSKLVGANLIHYKRLTTDHLVAHPRKDLEYRFDYISDRIDLLDTLFVSAEVKVDLELSGGSIKINIFGRALYDNKETRKFWEDEIKCTYRNETFSVQLLASAFSGDNAIVDQDIYDQLKNNKLEATHICTEVILGGESIINMYMTKNDEINTRRIEGELDVNIDIKEKILIKLKASLEMQNDSTFQHEEQRIFVYSKPPFKRQPNTPEEMLQYIKNMPVAISEEKHFKMFTGENYPEVTGVPIRYKLTPLDRVLTFDNGLRKSFRVIEPALLNEFVLMLATLNDFQALEFVKRKLYEREPRLVTMLKDKENPITIKITAWETELASKAKMIQTEADIVYKNYKQDKDNTQPEDLRDVIRLFNENFDIVKVYEEIEEFRRECKREIVGIRMSDATEEVEVTFFSNEIQMEEWYSSEKRMKILLHTGSENGQSPAGAFLRLYNLSSHLKTLAVDVGIAYPSISKGFKLLIKANASESLYQAKDTSFALEILGLAVGRIENVPRLFWTANGALTGIRLPLGENLSDIPSLIALSKEFQDVKVCPTYITLRGEIAKKDGRVKIILEVNALESIIDSILSFRKLRTELEKSPGVVPVDWAVGTFDLGDFHDAPVAFAFLDGQLFSVCLDNLDILILLEQLRSETPDFDILKPEKVGLHCLYPKRANFGIHVAELLGQYHGNMTEEVEELESFARPVPILYEYLEKYLGLLDTIHVNREYLSGQEVNVISAVASICLRTYPQMLTNMKSMGWNDTVNYFKGGLLPSSWIQISAYLKEFLANENPFLAKADYLRKKYSEILEIYEEKQPVNPTEAIESIKVILEHEDPPCPPDLAAELTSFDNAQPEITVRGYANALNKYCENEFSRDEYFDLRHFMNFAEILRDPANHTSINGMGSIVPTTIGLYIKRVIADPILAKFPGIEKKLQEYIEKENYFQTLSLMTKIQYDHRLFLVHQWFYTLQDIDDVDNVKKMVNMMGKEEFSDGNYEDLWNNPKFAYYMLKGVNRQSVLEAVAMYQCSEEVVPDYMPVEFEEKLIPILLSDDDLVFEWKQEWETVEDALEVLQAIAVRKSIPKTFQEKLRRNIANNIDVKTALENANALYYWDNVRSLFLQPWDIPTICKAVEKLVNYMNRKFEKIQTEISESSIPRETDINSGKEVSNSNSNGNDLIIKDSWITIAENVSPKLDLEKYHRISEVIPAPVINHREINKSMGRILPYVIQRAKFLSTDPLSPSNVYNYVKYPEQIDATIPGVIDFGDSEEKENNIPMVSRGDILTFLFNSSDPAVSNNLIQLIGKTPTYSLPLAIQDIDATQSGNKFILLQKQLENIPIRWEPIPGEIVENRLFADPFNLTVVVRIGENLSGGEGKSPIVNSIMVPPHNSFSSIKDSQSDHLQRPVSHPGFVELSWLTKETCKDTFWSRLLDSYYYKFKASGSNEVLLLANLHGDAMEHLELLIELNRMGANFLALLMPSSWEHLRDSAKKFTAYLGSKDNVQFAFVDPIRGISDENHYSEASVINSREIRLGKTTILENLLIKSFEHSSPAYFDNEEHVFTGVQEIETVESRYLLNLVKKYSCRTVRKILNLHSLEQYNRSELIQNWNASEDLQKLITAFLNILRLPWRKRESSLVHVKRELSILSSESLMKIRKELFQLIEELKTSTAEEIPFIDEIRNLHNQVKALRAWIDERTLGLEHFFREVSRCHEVGEFQEHLIYGGRYADHILKGNEIEIFNREAGDIFWGNWMRDVFFQNMPPEFPNYRVFVVSIIGLISSGKSMLLNALFGCKFSVSIGGGTRGIFMKLLFLEDELKQQLKVDVIILLDTQGISTIANVGDEETLQKEQQLMSLVVGLSNLVMLNSRGTQMGNMSNVLEIVFAKLTAIEEVVFIPDFLLVHHQTEHRDLQTEMVIAELTDALRAVSDLTENNELEFGVRDKIGRRLNKIMRRVKHRDIVHQISPFMTAPFEISHPSQEYTDSVVRLYEKILETCQESDKILTFGEWYGFSEKLWKGLNCHPDNFPLKFANSAQTHDYLNLQKKIVAVKDSIDWAFMSHEVSLKDLENLLKNEEIEMEEEEEEEISVEENTREKARKFYLENKIWKALRKMAGTCERMLEDGQPCQPCAEALQAKESLLAELKGSNFRFETQEILNDYIVNVRTSIWNRLNQSLNAWEMNQKEIPEDAEGDAEQSTEESYPPKTLNIFYNNVLETALNDSYSWIRIPQMVSPKTVVVPADTQIINEVVEYYRLLPHIVDRIENLEEPLPDLGTVKAFDLGYYNAIRVFQMEVPENEETDKGISENVTEGADKNTSGADETDKAPSTADKTGKGASRASKPDKGASQIQKPGKGTSWVYKTDKELSVDEIDCGCSGNNKERTPYVDWLQKDWLEGQLQDISELMWQSRCYDPATRTVKWVYEVGMLREFKNRVVVILEHFEERARETLLPNFKWEAHIYGILYFISYMRVKQREWDVENAPLLQIAEELLETPTGPKPDP